MPDPFRVAIIGHTGHGNYGHYLDRAFEGVEGTEVIALSDPDDEGRNPLSERFSERLRPLVLATESRLSKTANKLRGKIRGHQ